MVRPVYATLLVLSVTATTRSQFFDFFSALQPVVQPTLRPLFQLDITTKRLRTTKRVETTTKRSPFIFYSSESDRRTTKRIETTTKRTEDKQRTKNVYDVYSTTAKPTRKTTKNNRRLDTTRDNTKLISKETSRNRNVQQKPKQIGNTRNVNVNAFIDKPKSIYNNNDDDRLIFDDGKRNTVINYEPTRPSNQEVTKKNQFVYARPGVKPVVVNGPPITNRPVTQRPAFGPQLTDDVTPELIIGPNEDYMSTVDKKRHIEVAEKMCDRYKALDVKQVQAIPLLPSPDAVRVNVSTCTPQEAPLIVGGKVVSIQQFRHMALLGWTNLQYGGYSWKCGGSLVSDRFVLTAAHCAYQDRDTSVALGPPKAVQLGSSELGDPNALIVKVAAVIRHPKYKVPKSYYDIALVKMANTITFSNNIRPACLGIPPAPGRPIVATGWGKTEFGGNLSQELRSVSLPIWDITECYQALGTSRRLPEGPDSDSQICAGEKKGGKDTCQGDSGGPAQIQDGCMWRVVAVTSLGRSCGAKETPALYAKVPRAFVSAVVFEDNQQPNNNQQSNKTPQRNTNQQQTNNWNPQKTSTQTQNQQWNNQQNQWNTQRTTTQKQNQQWNNQQNQWNTQRTTTQKQNQQWNNQQLNNWNTQQQTSTQKPNNQWNNQQSNNQQESWTWNRQGDTNKNPTNNNQWNYNNQGSNNEYANNNVKRNDQNSYYQNEYNIQKQQENTRNNDNSQSNNAYTTKKPSYNNNTPYSNSYVTEQPIYNKQSNYNYGYTTEKPLYNYNNAYTENPVHNQNGYYNSYTTEKPSYNSHSGYYSGYEEREEPSGYRNDGAYNDRIWWT